MMDIAEVKTRAYIALPRCHIFRLHQIDPNRAVLRTQYARLDDHHSIERFRIADSASALTVASVNSKVLALFEG
jgi:hypothetical protein